MSATIAPSGPALQNLAAVMGMPAPAVKAGLETSSGKSADPAFVLHSWKDIADYLSRGTRTVQRWERLWDLPVHRVGTGKRSPVYAVVTELKLWMVSSSCARAVNESAGSKQRNGRPPRETAILIARMYELGQAVARNTRRQQQQIEAIRAQLASLNVQLAAGRRRRSAAARPHGKVAQ
jgi:hypothetical protein